MKMKTGLGLVPMGQKSLTVMLTAVLAMGPTIPSRSYAAGMMAAPMGAGARVQITPVRANGWANTIGAFFNSPTSDLSMLSSVLPHLSQLDLNDPKVRASIEPVTRQIQMIAEQLAPAGAGLIRKELIDGQSGSEQLTATLEKLEILNTMFAAHLTEHRRLQVQEISQVWRGQLSEEKLVKLNAKMKGIAESMKGKSDVTLPDADKLAVDASPLGQKDMPKEGQLQPSPPQQQILAAAKAHGIDLPQAKSGQYETTDLATMEKLLKGYAGLNGRLVYGGGNADADLLRQLSGKKFEARGVLEAEFHDGIINKTVSVYLKSEDGSRKVYLYANNFFRTKSAQRYLQSLPVGVSVIAYFTVSAPGRLVTSSPFAMEEIIREAGIKLEDEMNAYGRPDGSVVFFPSQQWNAQAETRREESARSLGLPENATWDDIDQAHLKWTDTPEQQPSSNPAKESDAKSAGAKVADAIFSVLDGIDSIAATPVKIAASIVRFVSGKTGYSPMATSLTIGAVGFVATGGLIFLGTLPIYITLPLLLESGIFVVYVQRLLNEDISNKASKKLSAVVDKHRAALMAIRDVVDAAISALFR